MSRRRRRFDITLPVAPYWTIDTAAELFSTTPKAIHDMLCKYRDALPPPRYKRRGRHPRRLRWLNEEEIKILAEIRERMWR